MIQDKQKVKNQDEALAGRRTGPSNRDREKKKRHDVNGSIYRPDEVPDGWILPDLRRRDVASSARSFPLSHHDDAQHPMQHKQLRTGSHALRASPTP